MLSVFGLVVKDPAVQDQLVTAIGTAIPPLEPFARTALQQVSAGAIPRRPHRARRPPVGVEPVLLGADYAMSRIFVQEKSRDEIRRTLRGLLLATLLVAFPIAIVFAGAAAQWLLDRPPDKGLTGSIVALVVQLATPIGSFLVFVVATVLVYRFVPARRVPVEAWRLPAIVVGLLLAAFTQVFAFLAPLMFRTAALYGAIVAVFALLSWLAIGFNMLLIGGAWTHVRAVALSQAAQACRRGCGRLLGLARAAAPAEPRVGRQRQAALDARLGDGCRGRDIGGRAAEHLLGRRGPQRRRVGLRQERPAGERGRGIGVASARAPDRGRRPLGIRSRRCPRRVRP